MFHTLCRICGRALDFLVILLMTMLLATVVWGVLARLMSTWFSDIPSAWTKELSEYLLMWLALFGAAAAYQRNAHLGVDYVVQKLDRVVQRLLRAAGALCVLAFVAQVMVWGGWQLATQSWNSNQRTAAMDLPMAAVYFGVPASGILLMLFAFAHLRDALVDKPESPVETPPMTEAPQS